MSTNPPARQLLRSVLLSCVWAACAACFAPGEDPQKAGEPGNAVQEAEQGAPDAVRRALLTGNWNAALAALDALEKERPEAADWWTYLRAATLWKADKKEQALVAFTVVEKREPPSSWRYKALFARADILRELGRTKEAEAVYEQQAARLRSAGRQDELAAIYFRFADLLSTPPTAPSPEKPTLDYARAAALYAKVLELDAPEATRERARYRMVVCRGAQQNWAEAMRDAQAYLAEFDPSAPGHDEIGAHVFEVRYRLGGVQLASGSKSDARRTYEDLSALIRVALAGEEPWKAWRAAQSEADLAALKLQDGDAMYAIAGCIDDPKGAGSLDSVAALERFLAAYPDHPKSSAAAFEIGQRYEQAGRDEDAVKAYSAFLARPEATGPDAVLRANDARLRMLATYRRAIALVRLERFDDAMVALRDYVARFPTGPDWAASQQALIDAEYQKAAAQNERAEFAAARETWRAFLEAHPLDARAQQAAYLIGETFRSEAGDLRQRAEAEKNLPAAQARIGELLRSAIGEWRNLVARYPGTDWASSALFGIAEIQEQELEDLEAAVATYRECNFGTAAGSAASRLFAMTQPSLVLVTERVFRTGEEPRVKVQVRNVEKVELQLYALDLEAYFRKHLSALNVGDLDLDLIAADQTRSVPVAGYARYKPIEQELELPVSGAGTWAVAVTAGEQRATTLVLASDVDVLVRSSQKEVLVFAQDRVRDQAAAGVTVLVAAHGDDGKPVMREAKTGADGVARVAFEHPSAGEVAVFAARDKQCAAVGLSQSGQAASSTVSARGLVYTDRPVYRPGENVGWRAILRDAKDGRYSFEPGAKVKVDVADSQGRTIRSSELALSAFGTLHGELALDPFAPVGDYTVSCLTAGGAVHVGTFQVQQFQTPRVDLVLSTPRDVYFRGEVVELTLRADYYWGEPVANSPIEVKLPDFRTRRLTTDAKGEARLSFDTRDFSAEGPIGFQATLTQEQVAEQKFVYIALREFSASLAVQSDVVLAGSSFDVELKLKGADDQPIEKPMTLSVLKRESRLGGTFAEIEVAKYELMQGPPAQPATGVAHQAVKLDKGGSYLLRAEGRDRFGNIITAQHLVFISGDDDQTRLRFVVKSHQLQVGEKTSLELVNRAGAALALITFEGETILEYRVVRLAQGANAIEVAVDAQHYPSFTLAAGEMVGTVLHADQVAFRVTRELKIAIAPERPVYAPGEEIAVLLTATDQLGRPVAAELSLAAVDEALFDLFPDATPRVRAVFDQGLERKGGFATSSSCTFRYDAQTRQIASAVLAEADRARLEAQWRAGREQTLDDLRKLAKAKDQSISNYADADLSQLRALGYDGAGAPAAEAGQAVTGRAEGVAMRRAAGRAGGGPGGKRSAKAPAAPASGGPSAPEAVPQVATETAFWSPSIVTDKDGKARVTFRVPPTSARWRLVSRGVDAGTLVGDAEASFVSKEEFFAELRLPPILTEGDQPRLVARVHNLTGMRGKAHLVLRVTLGKETQSFPADVELGAAPEAEFTFPALAAIPGVERASFELAVDGELDGQAAKDTLAATISARPYRPKHSSKADLGVQPWGIEYADAESGTLLGNASLSLELDPARRYGARSLDVFVGPSVDRLLIAAALGEERWLRSPMPPTVADHAGELIGVAAVLDLMSKSGRASNPEYARLAQRAQALAARLVAMQRPEGGWSWSGKAEAPHPESSCMAVAALVQARARGVLVPDAVLAQGQAYLAAAFRDAAQQADEVKAMISWALAESGRGDFGALNRLHRLRESLSPAALAYTTLALAASDRAPMAAELASVLAERIESIQSPPERPQVCFTSERNAVFNRPRVEMTALALLALERALPKSERIAPGVEYLLAHRPWISGRARGMSVAALAGWTATAKPATELVRVGVRVDGGETRTIELGPQSLGETLSFGLPEGASANLGVELTLAGRGEPHYSLVLRGFSSDVGRKGDRFRVLDHRYLAEAPTWRGAQIATGFSVLQDSRGEWRNEVRHLGFGATTHCVLRFMREWKEGLPREESDYLMASIPLPAGTALLEGSLRGDFVRSEPRAGAIDVQIGPWIGWGTIEYDLIGAVPGEWRALPVVLTSVYDPGRMAVGEPGALAVLPRGEASADPYRPTPDELYFTGEAMFLAGERAAAADKLQRLFDEFEPKLREDVLSKAARMLLFARIDQKDARGIVRYFEVLKEKDPELFIPLDEVMAVGEAYRNIEEHERALWIFRAVIEEDFGTELRVVGTLEEEQELDGALRTLERLCLEYPDAAPVVAATLAHAGKLLELAPRAAADASLRRAGRDRTELSIQGILELQRFLALYPRDPLAPEAGLNLVSAHLDLEDYARGADIAGELAAVYVEPRFADAFLYSRAVALWYLSKDDEATKLLERIAAAEYTAADGRRSPSINRDLALYILGQIYDSRQQYVKASEYYERVQKQFPDAREALASFREKRLALDEVTTVLPDEKADIEVRSKNLSKAEMLAYPVDLMTLYLREKNLSRIAQLNLAGIKPPIERTIELQDDKDLREARTRLGWKERDAGAYLLILRGDELHASALVLVSRIEIEVQQDPASGHVRVQVREKKTGKPVRDVDVRVIGSQNQEFLSGRTDPRGVFAADGLVGQVTVIARSGEREYAFFRGTQALALADKAKNVVPAQQAENADYFQNVRELNRASQEQLNKNLGDEIRRERKGVQVKDVK